MTTPMIITHTPVDDRLAEFGLLVKREDLSCPPPGPPFSKARGVFAHIEKRAEPVIGVLDTRHSQGGWAVARACQLLGKRCVNFYPSLKGAPGPHEAQKRSADLGALLVALPGGRSAVLYHGARARLGRSFGEDAYLMPNALKLAESVEETCKEAVRTAISLRRVETVLVSASSATLAAGVLSGLVQIGWEGRLVIHLGYSRSEPQVRQYVAKQAGLVWKDATVGTAVEIEVIDEGYQYADRARPGAEPPFPCNEYYDLKAFRWWVREGYRRYNSSTALLWNIG